jgi:hypothetical protein
MSGDPKVQARADKISATVYGVPSYNAARRFVRLVEKGGGLGYVARKQRASGTYDVILYLRAIQFAAVADVMKEQGFAIHENAFGVPDGWQVPAGAGVR